MAKRNRGDPLAKIILSACTDIGRRYAGVHGVGVRTYGESNLLRLRAAMAGGAPAWLAAGANVRPHSGRFLTRRLTRFAVSLQPRAGQRAGRRSFNRHGPHWKETRMIR